MDAQPMPKRLKEVNAAIDTAAELLVRLSEEHGDIEMELTNPMTGEVTGIIIVSTHAPAAQAVVKAYRAFVAENGETLHRVYETEMKSFNS